MDSLPTSLAWTARALFADSVMYSKGSTKVTLQEVPSLFPSIDEGYRFEYWASPIARERPLFRRTATVARKWKLPPCTPLFRHIGAQTSRLQAAISYHSSRGGSSSVVTCDWSSGVAQPRKFPPPLRTHSPSPLNSSRVIRHDMLQVASGSRARSACFVYSSQSSAGPTQCAIVRRYRPLARLQLHGPLHEQQSRPALPNNGRTGPHM